jgi:formylglycine-generating enzyme required for sulfatase activity
MTESVRFGRLADQGSGRVEQPQGPVAAFDRFAGKEAGDEMRKGIRMRLNWVPSGWFVMGSPESEEGRIVKMEAQVEVTITKGFWMGKFEVTQDEYKKILGINPSRHIQGGGDAPVDQVSWDDAINFCIKLTEQEKGKGNLPNGWRYDLPTEAQWEYACRAGTETPFCGEPLDEYAWYSDENNRFRTQPVGTKKPNAWGLHDMHGNLREWCRDWFVSELASGADPSGPPTGEGKVYRGGFFNHPKTHCRAASRSGIAPNHNDDTFGFRVVLVKD